MKSAFHPKPLRYPQSWSELPGGDELKQAIEGVCDDLSQRVFGYNLVKLGNLSSEIKLPGCAIRNQVAQTQVATEASSLISYSDNLPYIENSIDGFLLANELDFARDPHEILREVDRTITANGYVIISGFNPYSLTGLARFLPIKKAIFCIRPVFSPPGGLKTGCNCSVLKLLSTGIFCFPCYLPVTTKVSQLPGNNGVADTVRGVHRCMY